MNELKGHPTHMCRTVVVLSIFGIAMGFLESAVVVYLRQLYYPEGFTFPLKTLPSAVLGTEIAREVSTLVMLWAVGVIAGRNFLERLSHSLYCFGIWDIFYYVWLKVLLDWPPSLLTWDILFLVPTVWAGPVLAPLIVSLTMIFFAAVVIRAQMRGLCARLSRLEWALLLLGGTVIFVAFVWDYAGVVVRASGTSATALEREIALHVPAHFQWPLFTFGEVLLLGAIGLIGKRTKEEAGCKGTQ